MWFMTLSLRVVLIYDFYPSRTAKSIKNQEAVLRTTSAHPLKAVPKNGVAIIVLPVRMCYIGTPKRSNRVVTRATVIRTDMMRYTRRSHEDREGQHAAKGKRGTHCWYAMLRSVGSFSDGKRRGRSL